MADFSNRTDESEGAGTELAAVLATQLGRGGRETQLSLGERWSRSAR